MDTKFYPNINGIFNQPATHLNSKDMRAGLEMSLKVLGTESVDLWYLHAPDRSVDYEDICRDVNELSKEGKFKRWGVSNFMAWEGICHLTSPSYFKVIQC